nr:DUF4235 domain-containing protein [uncultured Friedmanniella sp.]
MSGSAQLPTTVTEKVLSKVYVVAVGLMTTVVARQAVAVGWRVVTGERPPKGDDPEVTKVRARIWGLASAVGLALTRLLVRRTGIGTPGH